ncbi:MAG: sensor histidine kinase [Gemmatimonadaceae bacterium]
MSGWLCIAGAVLGLLGILGWLTHLESWYTIVPGQPPMMPNSAFALTLVGLAGALLHRGKPPQPWRMLVTLASLVVLAIGLGSLVEYLTGVDLRMNQLFVRSAPDAYPRRPSLLTAMALAPLGLALLVFDWRPTARTRLSEWLVISTALVGLVGLTAQLLGTGAAHRLPRMAVVGMAVPTSIGILVSSIGLLLARPTTGFMAVALSEGPGGILVRRVAVTSVVLQILLGLGIARMFVVIDLEEFPLIVASVVVAITVAGLVVIVVTARLLNDTNEELVTSRARTREVISLASDGIFMADMAGRYTDVNEAGCRMLGLSRAEIIGKKIVDFIHPDEFDRLAAARHELLKGGSQMAEWHFRHKDGGFIPVEVSTKMLPGGRWQGLVRDIRERKAAEEEARRAQAKIEGIISLSADAIICLDHSQRITIFNHGAERAFGWTAEEAIGQPLDLLIPERLRAAHRSHIQAFGDEPTTARRMGERGMDISGLRKDGTEFIADAAIAKMHIGDELFFTVDLRDVTRERHRAEQDQLLAAIGLLLTSSLEQAEVVKGATNLLVGKFADVCVVDLVDDPGGEATMTRSAVVHRDPAKADAARALQRLQLDRLPPHIEEAKLPTRRTKMVSDVTPEYLDSIALSDDHRRLLRELAPTSLIAVPLQARGLLLGVLTFGLSGSTRRFDESDAWFVEQVGQRLALAMDNARLYATATRAVAARNEVLRIVAHDLRNPLGTILMGASLLHESLEPDNPLHKSSLTIETAAKRMNRLIRDLLDVTRSEAGTLAVEHACLSTRAVVKDAVDAQLALAGEASIELRVQLASAVPDVLGDRDRLLQIFENLIGNAIKFTAPKGTIEVGAITRERDVMFWVKDTGEGISAEDLPHVFDRLWERRRQKGGAGLGLLIVKALIQAHGGHVWVESAPGRGSSFFFTIPIALKPTTSPERRGRADRRARARP